MERQTSQSFPNIDENKNNNHHTLSTLYNAHSGNVALFNVSDSTNSILEERTRSVTMVTLVPPTSDVPVQYSDTSITSSSIKTTVLDPTTLNGESNSKCKMTIRSLTHNRKFDVK